MRVILPVVLLLLTATAADAFRIRTSASASASACCLPNGQEFTTFNVDFLVEVSEAEPELFGSTVSFRFQANSQCDFSGFNLNNTSTDRFTIHSRQTSIQRSVNDIGPRCPFGLRARSIAAVDIVPNSTVQSVSECWQPCFGCNGPPFVE
jgi:hypothetical protein